MNKEEKKQACLLARGSIETFLKERRVISMPSDLPKIFSEPGAAFVTLNRKADGALRGCIGSIMPYRPLGEDIIKNAIQAAINDPRFKPLSLKELSDITLEVSILATPKRLHYQDVSDLLNKIRPGIDGVIIRRDHHQATFLPSVWEQIPDKNLFMQHLCAKAGLRPDAYLDGNLDVMTYQAQICHENMND